MDMELVIKQLRDTAAVVASIPARPADVVKDPGGGLGRGRRFFANHKRQVARHARLMAEMQRMLNSLNRKPQ
jgi:hypothetical protein